MPTHFERGARVVFDVAEYPSGYAMGATPTGETAEGTLYAVEGDAGLGWALVEAHAGGYRHVPLDRMRAVEAS